MDWYGKAVADPVLVHQSSACLSTSFIETVLTNSGIVGKESRTGPDGLRNSFHAKDEGDTDLSPNQEYTSCAATPGSLQTGKYCSVSRD